MEEIDQEFFKRADAHIRTANEQLSEHCQPAQVTDSLMYGSARFNAWVLAFSSKNAEDMQSTKEEGIDYIMKEYRKMLEANIDDYIQNYAEYTKRPQK